MRARATIGRGGVAAAACVACCAPALVAALGVTAGLAAALAIFVGLATAIAAVLAGGTWAAARVLRARGTRAPVPSGDVPVAPPTRR